ncbi:MAG: hypothetical protein EPO02_12985 [Nitrospirae bacterium]|nr:MAG: hypothetical protein EPO02_12985 [Nitrospirota bacterium]
MSRDEQLRSAGLALEEHAELKRQCAAIEAAIIRHGRAAATFGTFCNHLSVGSDNGWDLKELESLPGGEALVSLIAEYRAAKLALAASANRLKDLGY